MLIESDRGMIQRLPTLFRRSAALSPAPGGPQGLTSGATVSTLSNPVATQSPTLEVQTPLKPLSSEPVIEAVVDHSVQEGKGRPGALASPSSEGHVGVMAELPAPVTERPHSLALDQGKVEEFKEEEEELKNVNNKT